MPKTIKGVLDARELKIAICVARFNSLLTEKLVDGAVDCLVRHGAADDAIDIYWTPGSFELPYLAGKLLEKAEYSAIICLGAVIRGQTPHFDYIATEVSKGISHLALKSGQPVIYGLITADTLEQAIERAGTKSGNKGWDAALSAIEMANLYSAL
ncbi:MAG: 6,7-dimethyl-8-ribityllumazine synthase [candidate division Zixibacteria bacterium]|nr:6,7-dimethyl-8-ribityllumazine synthase [candidate division Zixibacteria bacterium]